jgi:SET domain-containing protein
MAKRKLLADPKIDETKACFKLKVKSSAIHRWGVFAGEAIPKRRKIIEYTGERLNRKQVRERANSRLVYLFTLDKYWTLDGSVGGSGAEYVNHCCDPNVYASVQKGHILYFAKRDIRKGEELTLDYRFGKDVERIACHCGAENCRGTINLYD